jgi:hypothetical protein
MLIKCDNPYSLLEETETLNYQYHFNNIVLKELLEETRAVRLVLDRVKYPLPVPQQERGHYIHKGWSNSWGIYSKKILMHPFEKYSYDIPISYVEEP